MTVIEAQALYPWTEDMGEISGFGGGYEEACRRMVWAGLAWLEGRPNADLRATVYKNVTGILNPESEDAKELEDAIVAEEPDCTGAMHQFTMQICMYVARHGWQKFVDLRRESVRKRLS